MSSQLHSGRLIGLGLAASRPRCGGGLSGGRSGAPGPGCGPGGGRPGRQPGRRGRHNRGKGFAVRTGMLAAQGELVVFTEADGSYRPSNLDQIMAALAQASVAIGTRASGTSGPVARRAASRVFNLAIRRALGLSYGDTRSGLKEFRWAAAQQIFSRAASTALPSMSRCCGWLASSASRWPRSRCRPWSGRAARSRWWPMPWRCSASLDGPAGGDLPGSRPARTCPDPNPPGDCQRGRPAAGDGGRSGRCTGRSLG
jgi:Glycosyl transferase family 2